MWRRLRSWCSADVYARRRRIAVYLLVSIVWGLMLWRIQDNYDRDIRRAQQQLQTACRNQQQAREVLRQVIVAAAAGTGGLDYEKVPGFDVLDSETQQFLRNLRALALAGTEQSDAFKDRLLLQAPSIACPGDKSAGI
jgi:hypothetical protein